MPLIQSSSIKKEYSCVLTAFVYVCGNLDRTGWEVDLVFKIGIVHKLQLQRRRALQRVLLFSILRLQTHTCTHAHTQIWVRIQIKTLEKRAYIVLHSVTSHIAALKSPSVATVYRLSSWLMQHLDNVKHTNNNYSALCLPSDSGGPILSLSSENNSRYQSRHQTERLISNRDAYHRHMRCHTN